ncbi:peptide-methionine (S)-S-oxide reductase MsrA [Sphingomonas daechungensis]|uniref:peptide-methionine (S)-S-oxide reductase MsrA n=2 Tax=Sphingomonas daechungensis TaxID=1176646 RepID=UPI0031EAA4B5
MRSRLTAFLTVPALCLSLASTASAQAPTETAVLAGGCFWGMEAVFEHVKGVHNVVSGYAGGQAHDASYDKVSTERTGHAEAVKITFDPRQVSYAQLLKIYFSVAHDPTQVNRQGPDVGPSYRSAIFPQTPAQKQVAASFIRQLNAQRPIATKIEGGPFFAAEAYHQDFARKHPQHPYIVINDEPKVAKLKRAYPQYWKG